MIRTGFDRGALLDMLRASYRASRPRHALLPAAFEPQAAADLRAGLDAAGLDPFDIADRGRLHRSDTHEAPAATSALRAFAAAVVEEPLAVDSVRWLRLAHGDYELMRGDAAERPPEGRRMELTLDLSDGETRQAEMIYTNGADAIVVPQSPGLIALVERAAGDGWYRYQRYLDHRVGAASVYRLQIRFRFGDNGPLGGAR